MQAKFLILFICSIVGGAVFKLYPQTQFRHFGTGVESDSLPADGQSEIELTSKPDRPDDGCNVKNTYVSGDVRGVKWDTLIVSICEQSNRDTIITKREVDLAVNNVLSPPAHIQTGDHSRVEVTYPDGSVARIGPNSDVQLEEAFLPAGTEEHDRIKEIQGEIWSAATYPGR